MKVSVAHAATSSRAATNEYFISSSFADQRPHGLVSAAKVPDSRPAIVSAPSNYGKFSPNPQAIADPAHRFDQLRVRLLP